MLWVPFLRNKPQVFEPDDELVTATDMRPREHPDPPETDWHLKPQLLAFRNRDETAND